MNEPIDLYFQMYREAQGRQATQWEIAPLQSRDYETLDMRQSFGTDSQAEAFLRQGKLGFVLLAGGVGSRLGHTAPKGTFPVGPISQKSLFQIHFEKLNVLRGYYGTSFQVYVMTSRVTHEDTIQYLRENGFFGFPSEDVFFFQQGEIPAINPEDGSTYLAEDGSVVCGPDGHGGLILALDKNGAFQHMREHGISTVCTFHVDNPVVPLGHEQLVGLHLQWQSDMTSLAVDKADATERVGNFVCSSEETRSIRVVEYIDFPEELAKRTTPDGKLEFWAASIGIHLIQVDFLRRMSENLKADPRFMPIHLPLKKIKTATGDAWAIKPERFIFDILPFAKNPLVIRAERGEVFATLKDNAEIVRQQLSALYASWLRRSGSSIPEDALVEIAPSFGLYFQQVAENPQRLAVYSEKEIYLH